jgi:Nucleotidyl transferase
MASQIVPVIMCGGAGTRLWPVSRESMPKQFVPLVGQASTFQQVLARITDPELFARPIVITKADFRFVVAEQLREHGIDADIVLEPMRRDSAPAVTVAAVLAAERDRNALVLVLAADNGTGGLDAKGYDPPLGRGRRRVAGLCAPLSTLRRDPRGPLRMTQGRCGTLLLHRKGLALSTPCRSPGASQMFSGLPPKADIQLWLRDL